MGWRARYPAQVWRACRETADRARVDQRRGHEVFGRGIRSSSANRGSSHHLATGSVSRSVNWYERAGRAPRRGYPLRILPLPPGGGGNLEPSSSARTRPIGRLALQGGLIPPDRAHSNGFQMSGEPNWCALPPFTTRGDNAQVMPCFAATLENCLDLQVLPRKLC